MRNSYFEGWTLYFWCCLGHHTQGVLAAAGLLSDKVSFILLAIIWSILYIAYQGLSVIRKGDSAGLDVSDYMMGMAIGTIIISAWPYVILLL